MSWVITFVVHTYDPATKKLVKEQKTLHPLSNKNEAQSTVKNLELNPNVSNVEMKEENGEP